MTVPREQIEVTLRFEGKSPGVIAEVLAEIANLVIGERQKDRVVELEAFLEVELKRAERDQSAQRKQIREFRMEPLSALPEQLMASVAELDRLNESLRSNLDAQEKLSSEIDRLVGSVGGDAAGPIRISVAARLADSGKDLIEARRIHEELSGFLESRRHEGRELRRRFAEVRARIADLQARVAETPSNEQLLNLTRDCVTLQMRYQLLLSNLHDTRLTRLHKGANVEQPWVRPSRIPSEPFWPNPLILVPSGVAFGLLIALLLILWAEFLSPNFSPSTGNE